MAKSRCLQCAVIVLHALCVPVLFAQESPLDPVPESTNPVTRWFQGFHRDVLEGSEELQRLSESTDQIDSRPVQRPEDERRLKQANELLAEQRWFDAVEVLDFLLRQANDAFTISDEREFSSLKETALSVLKNLPSDGLRTYENRYGVEAETLLEEALRSQDTELLRRVVADYPLTNAAHRAAQELARVMVDTGNLSAAASTLVLLSETTPDLATRQESRQHAAKLMARAGRLSDAQALVNGIPNVDRLRSELEEVPVVPTVPNWKVSPFRTSTNVIQNSEFSTPTLLPDWSVDLIDFYAAREEVNQLRKALTEQRRAAIPSVRPLVVQDRVAYRTLRGLQVRDLKTGGLMWEVTDAESPEQAFVAARGPSDELEWAQMRQYGLQSERLGSELEYHFLANLLYRDSVYGGVSSDGQLLYAIEENHEDEIDYSRMSRQWGFDDDDPSNHDQGVNELIAYDLETGRRRWVVGGTQIEDRFSRPLSGTFFLGPPLADNGQLLVIGEHDGEITLFALNHRSGEEIWRQPLSIPNQPIEKDVVRRLWSCTPVLADGLILCPTTTGWIFAVDRLTHHFRWAQRFSARSLAASEFQQPYSTLSVSALNQRWSDMPPLADQGRLYVTPQELPDEYDMTLPALYCLDLQTGEILWQLAKQDAQYVQGIYDGAIVTVGTAFVTGIDCETGKQRWRINILEGAVSGHGLIVGDHALIPVSGNRLVSIDLKQRRVETVEHLSSDTLSLGNLAWGGDCLISFSGTDVVAYPVGASESELTSAGERLEHELRVAELLLANGKPDAALQRLRGIQAQRDQQPDEFRRLKRQLDDLEWQCRVAQVKQGDNRDVDLLSSLRQLATTPERHTHLRRLEADQLMEHRNWQAATPIYLELLLSASADSWVVEGSLEVRLDGWAGSKLAAIDASLKDEERAAFQAQLRQLLSEAKLNPQQMVSAARTLVFHPFSQDLELQMALTAESEGRIAEGLLRCSRATYSQDPELAARAWMQYGDMLTRHGWTKDADECWFRILEIAPDSDAIRELARQAEARLDAAPSPEEPPPVPAGEWRLQRRGQTYDTSLLTRVSLSGWGLPRLRDVRLVRDQNLDRLRVSSKATGRLEWSLPMEWASAFQYASTTTATHVGPLVLVTNQGVVHALAFPEQQALWTWTPETQSAALQHYQPDSEPPTYEMQSINSLRQEFNLRAELQRKRNGFLVAANEFATLMLERDWVALDSLTGEVLWRDHEVRGNAVAFPLDTPEFATLEPDGVHVRSAVHGTSRRNAKLASLIEQSIGVTRQGLLVRGRTRRDHTLTLELVDFQGNNLWSLVLPGSARVRMTDESLLFVWKPDNQLDIIDLYTGFRTPLGPLPVGNNPNAALLTLAVMSDSQNDYVFINRSPVQWGYFNMHSIPLVGAVVAFDREGNQVWQREIEGFKLPPSESTPDADPGTQANRQNPWAMQVPVQEFDVSPLLIFVGMRPDEIEEVYYTRQRILALDKATGEVVVNWEAASESGGISDLYVDTESRHVDLHSYDSVIQLNWQPDAPAPPLAGE